MIDAEFRAAGTDLSERRRSGVSKGPLIDIAAAPDTDRHRMGRGRRRAHRRASPPSPRSAPTPHRRRLSRHRGFRAWAWPRRRSAISPRSAATSRSVRAAGIFAIRISTASRRAARDCPARSGNHLYSVAFDLGPCVAPHPSTMAAALLAYDARVATDQRARLSIGELLGDGSNGARRSRAASQAK